MLNVCSLCVKHFICGSSWNTSPYPQKPFGGGTFNPHLELSQAMTIESLQDSEVSRRKIALHSEISDSPTRLFRLRTLTGDCLSPRRRCWEVRSSDTVMEKQGAFSAPSHEQEVVLCLESQCEAGQDLRAWGGRKGQCGGNGPFMPCCLGKSCHFTFQLGRTPGSIGSATRGKWAQPSPGPLHLLLMNLLSNLPTFLYAN